jgi:hypothetical protein
VRAAPATVATIKKPTDVKNSRTAAPPVFAVSTKTTELKKPEAKNSAPRSGDLLSSSESSSQPPTQPGVREQGEPVQLELTTDEPPAPLLRAMGNVS